MKKINLILLSLVALFFAACTDDAVDGLKGIYDMDIYNFTEGTVGETETSGNVKLLSVTLTDEDRNTAAITFGSSAYILPAATYSSTSSIDAARQYAGTLNGSSFTGDIDVVLVDSVYYFTGLLSYSSGETFKVTYKGVLTFVEPAEEPVVGPTELTNLLSATSNVANGTNSVTLNLATSDVTSSYDSSTWSYVYSGTGYYLAVDFYSEDGYLAAGTYTAGDASALSSGEFAMGYDPGDIYGWGYYFTDWGTCWWTVEDGATSAEHITDGTISVSISGGVYTITLESSTANAVYTGRIDALYSGEDGESGSGGTTELSNAFSVCNNNTYGYGNTINVQIADANLSTTYNWTYYYWEITGTGNYISLDICTTSTDLALPTGTLNIVDSASAAEGDVIAGYTAEYYGYEYLSGSVWYTVENSVSSGEAITDGTVTITANNDGTYTIEIASSVANATYTGAISFLY